MPQQPNKPGGEFDEDGEARSVKDARATQNQSSVTPEDYPDPAGGDLAPGK